jgi:hypothetical protein
MTTVIVVLALALTPTHQGQVAWTIDGTDQPAISMNHLVRDPAEVDYWSDTALALTFDGPPPEPEPTPPPPEPEAEEEPPPPPRKAPPPPRNSYPPLTWEGLQAMKMCESTNNYQINTGNGFHGAVQWIQGTWNSAAARAGYGDWAGVPVEQVPADVQDAVSYFWWGASNPAQQWPVCHKRALAAMGY